MEEQRRLNNSSEDKSITDTTTDTTTATFGSKTCTDNHFPFLDLPPELILRVCDFLDSDVVANVLSKVCLFLSNLANDNLIWKTRIHKRWPGKRYPPVAGIVTFATYGQSFI